MNWLSAKLPQSRTRGSGADEGVRPTADEGVRPTPAERRAESCAREIDCAPPRKSSAERRVRTTSPKGRVDEAGGGSVISPEPSTGLVAAGGAVELAFVMA